MNQCGLVGFMIYVCGGACCLIGGASFVEPGVALIPFFFYFL